MHLLRRASAKDVTEYAPIARAFRLDSGTHHKKTCLADFFTLIVHKI